eukprot:5496889-Amphidinium_carterae.1
MIVWLERWSDCKRQENTYMATSQELSDCDLQSLLSTVLGRKKIDNVLVEIPEYFVHSSTIPLATTADSTLLERGSASVLHHCRSCMLGLQSNVNQFCVHQRVKSDCFCQLVGANVPHICFSEVLLALEQREFGQQIREACGHSAGINPDKVGVCYVAATITKTSCPTILHVSANTCKRQ